MKKLAKANFCMSVFHWILTLFLPSSWRSHNYGRTQGTAILSTKCVCLREEKWWRLDRSCKSSNNIIHQEKKLFHPRQWSWKMDKMHFWPIVICVRKVGYIKQYPLRPQQLSSLHKMGHKQALERAFISHGSNHDTHRWCNPCELITLHMHCQDQLLSNNSQDFPSSVGSCRKLPFFKEAEISLSSSLLLARRSSLDLSFWKSLHSASFCFAGSSLLEKVEQRASRQTAACQLL